MSGASERIELYWRNGIAAAKQMKGLHDVLRTLCPSRNSLRWPQFLGECAQVLFLCTAPAAATPKVALWNETPKLSGYRKWGSLRQPVRVVLTAIYL
jgi:hypothetical protein